MVSTEPGVADWVGKMEAGKNRFGFGLGKSILTKSKKMKLGWDFFSGGLTENAQPWRGPRSYGVEVNTIFVTKRLNSSSQPSSLLATVKNRPYWDHYFDQPNCRSFLSSPSNQPAGRWKTLLSTSSKGPGDSLLSQICAVLLFHISCLETRQYFGGVAFFRLLY